MKLELAQSVGQSRQSSSFLENCINLFHNDVKSGKTNLCDIPRKDIRCMKERQWSICKQRHDTDHHKVQNTVIKFKQSNILQTCLYSVSVFDYFWCLNFSVFVLVYDICAYVSVVEHSSAILSFTLCLSLFIKFTCYICIRVESLSFGWVYPPLDSFIQNIISWIMIAWSGAIKFCYTLICFSFFTDRIVCFFTISNDIVFLFHRFWFIWFIQISAKKNNDHSI